MRITNNSKLPAPIVRAVESHSHRGAEYSVTQLLRSPRHLWLERRHDDEISVDVTEKIWALFGTMVHQVLEAGEGEHQFSEIYMEQEVDGVRISGTSDLYDTESKTISDWKVTSVYSVLYGSRTEEWTQQLNIYAWLMRREGYAVDAIEVVAILRDWSKSKARFDKEYPDSQVVRVPLELWADEDADYFVRSRVRELEAHKESPDNSLPACSDEYRWKKPTKYAAMKVGRKSAVKLHDNILDAEKHAASLPGGYVEHRPSVATRCQDYCAAAQFCNQYQAEAKDD